MRLLIFLYLWLSNLTNYSQNINIRLYANITIDTFEFAPQSGKYELISDDRVVCVIEEGQSMILKIDDKKIQIQCKDTLIALDSFLLIRGVNQSNYFRLSSPTKRFAAQSYDNELYVKTKNNSFILINDVNFDSYVAGVVEAEGGSKAPMEYYKAQAVLCRTYAARYWVKHLDEGYNLCDGVHCQAYKGRVKTNLEILDAALETSGLIIVDSSKQIISATFYANSGGETVNSGDLWNTDYSYLRSKPDEFSVGKPGYSWKKEISLEAWKSYLNRKGIEVSDSLGYVFEQPHRLRYFNYYGNDSTLELKTIRTDWKLRSTFFSVEQIGDKVLLSGRGYGHGVGLSQEGAMEMARQNYSYSKIIKYYYSGVSLMNITSLNFFQIE